MTCICGDRNRPDHTLCEWYHNICELVDHFENEERLACFRWLANHRSSRCEWDFLLHHRRMERTIGREIRKDSLEYENMRDRFYEDRHFLKTVWETKTRNGTRRTIYFVHPDELEEYRRVVGRRM